MPRRDGTGPMGYGPMSGRGMGYCVVRYGAGLGLGCRRGFGRWFAGNNDADQVSSKTQKEMLQEEKSMLQSRMDAIDKQMED